MGESMIRGTEDTLRWGGHVTLHACLRDEEATVHRDFIKVMQPWLAEPGLDILR